MSMVSIPRLMISAPQKSSGKTTIGLGLAACLSSLGHSVHSFKKGPDYIDPMWHRLATGNECYNLDPWMMGKEACLASFHCHSGSTPGALAIIEGNHGLHDGLSLDGSDSSAGVASMLNAPVLLVLDSSSSGRGAAAVVMGMQAMPPHVRIAGVVLNRVRSSRQALKQKAAIEAFASVPVLGMVPIDDSLVIAERHLGLTTVSESPEADAFIRRAAEAVGRHCDIDAILQLFAGALPLEARSIVEPSVPIGRRARIGVFRDAAFCFYYPDNLEALERRGAELCFIDSMSDARLPDVDGLYIGGGFPESFLEEIAANRGLIGDVGQAVASGMPLYAECGGLIYLSQRAAWKGQQFTLAGLLPFDIGFRQRPAGHGYLELESLTCSSWFSRGERIRAHEFHYSHTEAIAETPNWQFEVHRGTGITGEHDGALVGNLFASYAHIHASAVPGWAETFVALCELYAAKSVASAALFSKKN